MIMNKLILRTNKFTSKEHILRYLGFAMHFPDYYGCNLDALQDCLGDVEDDWEILIERSDDDAEWFEKTCVVLERAAGMNPCIKLTKM